MRGWETVLKECLTEKATFEPRSGDNLWRTRDRRARQGQMSVNPMQESSVCWRESKDRYSRGSLAVSLVTFYWDWDWTGWDLDLHIWDSHYDKGSLMPKAFAGVR